MATAVGDIIEDARDQHPGFDDHRHSDRILLRQLSAYHRTLCVKATNANESILASAAIIPLPLTSFVAGYTLPAHQYVHGADVFWANGVDRTPLSIVPWAARNDAGRFPGAYIHGGVLYLRGEESDWTQFASIHLSYTPAPADFTALTDVISLPDTARDPCTAALALFMAKRTPPDSTLPPISLDLFVRQAADAEDAFLADVFLRRGNQDNRIRDVRSFA